MISGGFFLAEAALIAFNLSFSIVDLPQDLFYTYALRVVLGFSPYIAL